MGALHHSCLQRVQCQPWPAAAVAGCDPSPPPGGVAAAVVKDEAVPGKSLHGAGHGGDEQKGKMLTFY